MKKLESAKWLIWTVILCAIPVGLSLLVTGCGGSGGGGNREILPGGRGSFTVSAFEILYPGADEKNVCLQPDIQIFVPKNSGLCSPRSGLERYIGLRAKDDSDTEKVPLLPTVAFRNASDASLCIVETRPQYALLPGTSYYLSVDRDGSSGFVFNPANAREFTTGNTDSNCSNRFKVVENGYQESTVFQTGNINPNTGDYVFEEDDFLDLAVSTIAGAAVQYAVQLPTPSVEKIRFNNQIDPLGVAAYVRIIRWNLTGVGTPNAPIGFSSLSLENTSCAGLPDAGPNGSCVYVRQDGTYRGKELIIKAPGGAWPPDFTYFVFLTPNLSSATGKRLSTSWYKRISN